MYSFRIRFNTSSRKRLDIDETTVGLPFRERPSPTIVSLTSSYPADSRIRDAERLALSCDGFDTESDAAMAAAECRSRIMAVFSALYIGADFGDRAPGSGFTKEGRMWAQDHFGMSRVENDVHGTMIFETEPEPRFASFSGKLVQGVTRQRFESMMSKAVESSITLSDSRQLAYDLFGASFFVENEDARLIALMMSIETLIVQKDQSPQVVNFISSLIDQTSDQPELSDGERDSLKGSLSTLKTQSIGRSGRELVMTLEPRTYMGMSPGKFFSNCYTIRSELVHGALNRPTRAKVGLHAAQLELLVADLLAGALAPER